MLYFVGICSMYGDIKIVKAICSGLIQIQGLDQEATIILSISQSEFLIY